MKVKREDQMEREDKNLVLKERFRWTRVGQEDKNGKKGSKRTTMVDHHARVQGLRKEGDAPRPSGRCTPSPSAARPLRRVREFQRFRISLLAPSASDGTPARHFSAEDVSGRVSAEDEKASYQHIKFSSTDPAAPSSFMVNDRQVKLSARRYR